MNRTVEPAIDPNTDPLAAPWGSRRLPFPWREPVSFASLAAPCRTPLPDQRPASADLLPDRSLLGN